MLLLILGLALFFAVHGLTMARPTRARLIARLGEGPYKGFYSLASLLSVVIVVLGWQAAPFIAVWNPPAWTRHLAIPLVWIAFVLVVAAYVPSRIRDRARHPMLAGLKLWAFAHLIANGDLASVILFGSFLAYGVIDRIAVKRREAAEGRTVAPGAARGDFVAATAGTVAFLIFGLFLHPILIGVVAIPT